jgi:hypothetical protein
MITLTDIAYVRSGVADLDAAVRFAIRCITSSRSSRVRARGCVT